MNTILPRSRIVSRRHWSFLAITCAVLALLMCAATAAVSEFNQVPPSAPEVANGSLQVNTTPGGIGGWRFVGEQLWHTPGTAVGGLTIHPREIEFKPVTGYYQPVRDTVTINSGGAATVYQGDYAEAAAGTGGITVQLKPNSLAGAQWRFLGDTVWRNSGTSVTGLVAGTYLVESKPVAGRTTPQPLVASVNDGLVTTVYPTYYLADTVTGITPSVLSFATVTGSPTLPYQFVGQVRTDLGSGTGFVVTKPVSNGSDPRIDPRNFDSAKGSRVVATAAHLVFDYDQLTVAGNQQWLFQRDSASYEPVPRTPHGYYVFTSYAAAVNGGVTPGTSSPAMQVCDVAALYFTDSDAAPGGGASGFLASDNVVNEWLTGSDRKMLVGYPIDGISTSSQGRMFATTPVTLPFSAASTAAGGNHPVTYTTSAISSVGGNSGGPLCVQFQNGSYYPAAIYLGGTGQMMVRAIDIDVIFMFYIAQWAAEDGIAHGGGGITQADSPIPTAGTAKGTLTVNLTGPAGARWGLTNGSYLYASGNTRSQSVATYTVYFQPVPGWTTPASQTATVNVNQATIKTGTYVVAPTGALQVSISPAGAVSAGAQWQVDGGALQSSGATVSGLSVGSHTVAFSAVSGWTTPVSQTVTVNANQTTPATGIYVAINQTSSLQVSISPAGAVSAGAQWQVDGGALQSSGATVSGLSVGSHTVAFSTVGGWTTPVSQTVTVSANATTPATGTYVGSASSNAELLSFVPSAGTLNPIFSGGTFSYTATVPNSTTSITVTPTAVDNTARVEVNGTLVSSGAASGAIALKVGLTAITAVVTAPDGTTTQTYTLTVTRRSLARDLNNDGNADILFQNKAGQIAAWYMNGAGGNTATVPLSAGALGDWKMKGVADMNGDGNADLLFQNTLGQIVVWYMNGAGAKTSSPYLSTNALGDWRVVGVADMNNDGNADLIFQNNIGQIFAWYMDGAGSKTSSGYFNTVALGDWRVVGVADMNNDGNADLIFQNTVGQIFAWYMDGAGTKTSSGYFNTVALGDWRVVGVADMNNDGNADLIFQNTIGQIVAWYMNGAGTKTSSGYLYSSGLGDWRIR